MFSNLGCVNTSLSMNSFTNFKLMAYVAWYKATRRCFAVAALS